MPPSRAPSPALQALFAATLAASLTACGGGGGDAASPAPAPPPVTDTPAPPAPTPPAPTPPAPTPPAPTPPAPTPPAPAPSSFTLAGTLELVATGAVDSDSNDVIQRDQGRYATNDDPSTAQAVTAPLLLVGTVNEAGTGPEGNNRAAGDVDDWFRVALVAGQTVELEFAADPADSDIDLAVVAADASIVGVSVGTDTRYECVQVSADGDYYVNVNAFRAASIYNLRIGAPGGAASCANRTSGQRVVGDQLVAKASTMNPAQAQALRARLQAAGVSHGGWLAGVPASGVPGLLQLPAPRARAAAAGHRTVAQAAALTQAANVVARLAPLRTAKRLQAAGGFDYVVPNWEMQRHALVGNFPPSDRQYSYQRWHYEMINLPAAMARITALATQPTQRPVVAVIDDGVVLDHPDLQPQLFSAGRSFISRVTAGDNNTASGDNPAGPADQPIFHGTHVAGTVAAATFDGIGAAGVAPMAQILPLRVFPPDRGAALVDVVNAMLYAARLPNNSGTLPARRADVINLSLGGTRACDAAYQDAVNQVRAAGVIVVAATGNEGHNDVGQRTAVGSPANCNGVVAVSALDATRKITRYANTGAQVALAAPGGDGRQSTTGTGAPDSIYSDLATFDAQGTRQPTVGPMDGTSMATPHVSGVMALMRYVNPGLTVAQVDALLAQGALSTEAGPAGRDVDYGWGVVDARRAVDAALAAGSAPAPAPAGRVITSPSAIDFGSFQTTATLELALDAAGSETVTAVTSDHPAVTVAATAVTPGTGLGRYTLTVDRSRLAEGTSYPRVSVSTSAARTLTVQLSITRDATGGTPRNASFGPIYVLLVDPDTQTVVRTVQAVQAAGRYTWRSEGWTLPRVTVVAGSDLDNDNVLCQRGEACGGYPVLTPGRDMAAISLSGDRLDLNFQVSPLSGISAQSVSGAATPAWRRSRPRP